MRIQGWRQTIPTCLIGGSIDDAKTLDEAIHLAKIDLDLIEEGQDGTEEYTRGDVRDIRKWIKRAEALLEEFGEA